MTHKPTKLPAGTITTAVTEALREDIGTRDLTAELIPRDTPARARVSVREGCILCGTAWFSEVFRQLGAGADTGTGDDAGADTGASTGAGAGDRVVVHWNCGDGDRVEAGTTACTLEGPARVLLTGERTALNFLQFLSATATAARRHVDAIEGIAATILDTRKTIPGHRDAQKYAVRCGGARNHRHGLYDAVLIKENHIAAAGGLRAAVSAARKKAMSVMLEVEVESLDELREALACGVDRVLLDNFGLEELRQAVAERDASDGQRVALEASGGVDLDGIRAIARTGVDFISVGALTKHVRAVDFSMRVFEQRADSRGQSEPAGLKR